MKDRRTKRKKTITRWKKIILNHSTIFSSHCIYLLASVRISFTSLLTRQPLNLHQPVYIPYCTFANPRILNRKNRLMVIIPPIYGAILISCPISSYEQLGLHFYRRFLIQATNRAPYIRYRPKELSRTFGLHF